MSIKQLILRMRAKLYRWLDRPGPVDLPPADDPSATLGAWKLSPLYSKGGRWFPVFVRWWGGKIIVSWFDQGTKKNSRLEVDGASVYEGSDETMGPIGASGDRLYFCGEKSSHVHYIDGAYRVGQAAAVPSAAMYNIYGCLHNGEPVYGGQDAAHKSAGVFSAVDGRKLVTLPLGGLVAGLCEDSRGQLWAAHSWDETGISSSAGHVVRGLAAASIACVGETIYAGDMRSGTVWQVLPAQGGTAAVRPVLDLDASKVLRMYEDGGKLIIAACNPDTFATYNPLTGAVETIHRFDDEPRIAADNGTQIDTDIAPHPEGYLLCRAVDAKNTGYVYLARRIG